MANKNRSKLVVDILDPKRFIKVNELKEVSNPIFFDRNNQPTSDGLMSYDIFGITTTERREIFGYIDLGDWFIHPLYYKIWVKVDSKVRDCVHQTKNFIINSGGYLEENEDGKTGLKFLKDNLKDIKFKQSDSVKRGELISFLNIMKDKAFMKELIVLPPLYRDIKTSGGKTGVGEINTLYTNIIVNSKAITEAKDFGFDLSGATRGRMQELLVSVYDWVGRGTTIKGEETTGVLPGKLGLIRRAGTGGTSDYGSRNVIAPADLAVEKLEDVMVDMTHSAIPLSTVLTNFYPYAIYHIRRFFENEFSGDYSYPIINKKGELERVEIDDPGTTFSDERIKREIDRYIEGYANRLIPVTLPVKGKKNSTITMRFKGYNVSKEEYEKHVKNGTLESLPTLTRRLTWMDVFYISCNEFIEGKTVLVTRFPIDSYYNTIPTMININTTTEKEPMIIGDKYLKWYPKVRDEDIGTNTSGMFIDACNICNPLVSGMKGDYDGDTISSKGVYLREANEELIEYMNSKAFYVSLSGNNIRNVEKVGLQTIYSLTRVLDGTTLTPSDKIS